MNTNIPGYLILKKRKEKHLTQQELADKLYVSPTTISKWERGNSRPDLEKLKLLSSVLDIPLPLLLGIDSAETDESPEKTAASETESAEEATVTEKTSSVNESIILEPGTAIDEIPPDEKPPKEKLPRKRNRTIAILSVAVAVLLAYTAFFFLQSQCCTCRKYRISSIKKLPWQLLRHERLLCHCKMRRRNYRKGLHGSCRRIYPRSLQTLF